MNSEIRISDNEWKIMELFWEESMLTIGEIISKLDGSGWSESTIKTMVRRLVEKSAIARSGASGKYIFYPLVNKEECVERELHSIVNAVFAGSVKDMLYAVAGGSLLPDNKRTVLLELIKDM